MGRKIEVNKGDRYNMLTIIKEVEKVNGRRFMVQCDCGNVKEVDFNHMRHSIIKSCGCYRQKQFKEVITKHNLRNHYLYPTYNTMKQRCYNPNRRDYYLYGGRGITVCERWLNSFANFLEDMGDRPEGYSIERKNKDGNYEPDNCKWADDTEQANNRRPWGTAKNPNQTQLIFD